MITVTEGYDTNFEIIRSSVSQCQIPLGADIKEDLYERRTIESKGKHMCIHSRKEYTCTIFDLPLWYGSNFSFI